MRRTPFTERWLAALRSGDFEQGRGTLCYVDPGLRRYCCLGVLAELLGGLYPSVTGSGRMHVGGGTFTWSESTLLPSQRETVGMTASEQTRLVSLNDESGYDFSQIADEIERMIGDA